MTIRQSLKIAYARAVECRLPDMANLWLSKIIEIERVIGNLTIEEAESEH